MPDIYEDGSFASAQPNGESPSISFPLQSKGDTQTRMITLPLMQKASSFRGPTLGSPFPFSGMGISNNRTTKLVEYSAPSLVGEYMFYTAVWCDIPRDRIDAAPHTYTYQYPYKEEGVASIAEITKTVMSLVKVTYIHTNNPAEIVIRRAQRYVRYPNAVVRSGESQVDADGYRLAEDTDFSRWNGNIYEIRNRFVKDLTLGETLVL